MQNLELVRSLAEKVRAWAEEYQKFHSYNYYPSLGGLCAIASGELFKELTKVGIPAKLCISKCHCFILLDEDVVDITATQFGVEDKIFIEKHEKLIREYSGTGEYWEKQAVFDNLENLYFYQKERFWPDYQIVKLGSNS